MIEPTPEMVHDIRARIGGSEVAARSAAEAVLAIVVRDQGGGDLDAVRRRLHARRFVVGLGQREIAERMGSTQSHVSDMENGRFNDIRIGTLTRWASALGLRLRLSLDHDPDGPS